MKHRAGRLSTAFRRKRLRSSSRLRPRLNERPAVEVAGRRRPLGDSIEVRQSLDLRYAGTDAALTIAQPIGRRLRKPRLPPSTAGCTAICTRTAAGNRGRASGGDWPISRRRCRLRIRCDPRRAAVRWHASHAISTANCTPPRSIAASRLPAGANITGPAIVVEPLTTTIIDPGWQASVLSGGELLLTHLDGAAVLIRLPILHTPTSALRNRRPIRSSWRSSTTTSRPSPSRWASRSAIRR